jgi:hypothetical protein
MPQPADDPTPETPPAARPPRRTRKFSLPDHHHEEHPAGAIEAFLEGPPARRRSQARGHRADRPRPLNLRSADDWSGILQREAARQARYGRPTSILVLEVALTTGADGTEARARLLDVLGREARETDRATAAGHGRYLLLLPETGEIEAGHVADRIERGFRGRSHEPAPEREIRIEIAVARRGADPLAAIDDAERRLDGIADDDEQLEDAS